MKNYYFILLLSFFLLKGTAGFCTHHTITWTGSEGTYAFSPDTISAEVGDTIIFNLTSIHSAVEVSEAEWNIPGDESNGGFVVNFGGGSTVVTMAKTYYYVCQNHYSMNMKGRIFVSAPTGINSLTSAHVTMEIFPNPVSSGATIKTNLPAGRENQIRIFDMSGKCIYQKNNISPVQYLDLSEFSSGVYFVSIKSDDLYLEKKLIVSR